MGHAHERGVESTAAVLRHPLHPMTIAFPVAALMAAPAADVAAIVTGDGFWRRASRWLLAGGLASGAVAATVGLVDYASNRAVRRTPGAQVHAYGNALALALVAANLARRGDDAEPGGVEAGLSLATVALLGVTAWIGGEMSYRYGVGAIDDRRADARRRLRG